MAHTTTAPAPRAATGCSEEQLDAFHVMHRAMRTDAAALVIAIGALAPDDRNGAAELARWFDAFTHAIEHHHGVEDDLVWPAVNARVADFAADAERLQADHRQLDVALGATADAIGRLTLPGRPFTADQRAAAAAATALAAVLDDHLDREEAVLFPVLRTQLSDAEMVAIHEQAGKQIGVRGMAWLLPWAADHATDEERARAMAGAPRPMRLLLAHIWAPRYDRSAALVRAARAATAATNTVRSATSSSVAAGSSGRRRHAVAAAAAVGLLAVVLGACTSANGDDKVSRPTTTANAASPAHVVDIVAREYTFEVRSPRVAAGRVLVRFDNQGTMAHQIQLGRVRNGVDRDSFMAAFTRGGDKAALGLVEWHGGVNVVEPGASGSALVDLPAGDYLMACFVPDPEGGPSHIARRMVVALQVEDAPSAPPAPAQPAPVGTITLQDYAIALPKDFDGRGVYRVRNVGQESHELVVLNLLPGKTITDILAWQAGGSKGPAPYTYGGGASTLAPGATSDVRLTLGRGQHVAVCVVTGPKGMHVNLGMVRPFTIS